MYEHFTDRARKVMQLANQEAQRFNHEYIGTEHILLGLVKEGSGVAANVLKDLGVDLSKIREETEKIVHPGSDMVTMGKLPQTPRAKKVIELSIEAARERGDNHVGTEHLLIGLLREGEGIAALVFANLGVSKDKAWAALEALYPSPKKEVYSHASIDEVRSWQGTITLDLLGKEQVSLLGWVLENIYKNQQVEKVLAEVGLSDADRLAKIWEIMKG